MSKAGKIWIGAVGISMLVLPWLLNPYTLQTVITTITYAMLGMALMLSMKVGLLRFDIAGWWGVGAYVTALLMRKAGVSFWLTVPAGGLVAMALGWLVFVTAMRRGMMVFFLFGMIASMALYQVFGSVSFLGGWGGTGLVPRPSIGPFEFVGKQSLYYMGLFFLSLTTIVYRLLYTSRIGRAWNAIGSSVKLASSVGVNVVRYRMANVLIGNFFIAVAGSYCVAYSLVAVPNTFSFHNSVFMMMYAVVGGLSHALLGPMIGAAIVTLIPEYLRVTKEYETIITSVAIILIILLMPKGVLGAFDNWIKPRLPRRKANQAA
jgi:branched-chain amino acid transport system permease protein